MFRNISFLPKTVFTTARYFVRGSYDRSRYLTTLCSPSRSPPNEELGEKFRTPGYQAEKQQDEFPEKLMRKFKEKRKRPVYKADLEKYEGNEEAFRNLVFKWLLEAYPESLSRMEIAGRLRAHESKVKTLIIGPLCQEGKIFKWGGKVPPNERYMPNVKAPEYYEVTGETAPTIPNVNEQDLLLRLQPRHEKAPRNEKFSSESTEKTLSVEEQSEVNLASQVKICILGVGESGEDKGWIDLYEDTEEEEKDPEEWTASSPTNGLKEEDAEEVEWSDLSEEDSQLSEFEEEDEGLRTEDDDQFLLGEALENSKDPNPTKD